jgi:hypothetical protein
MRIRDPANHLPLLCRCILAGVVVVLALKYIQITWSDNHTFTIRYIMFNL